MTSDLHLLSRDHADDTPTHQVRLGGHSPLGSGLAMMLLSMGVTSHGMTSQKWEGRGWPGTCPSVVSMSLILLGARSFVTCWRHLLTSFARKTVCQRTKHQHGLLSSDSAVELLG